MELKPDYMTLSGACAYTAACGAPVVTTITAGSGIYGVCQPHADAMTKNTKRWREIRLTPRREDVEASVWD